MESRRKKTSLQAFNWDSRRRCPYRAWLPRFLCARLSVKLRIYFSQRRDVCVAFIVVDRAAEEQQQQQTEKMRRRINK